jgi:hypothetical protein
MLVTLFSFWNFGKKKFSSENSHVVIQALGNLPTDTKTGPLVDARAIYPRLTRFQRSN